MELFILVGEIVVNKIMAKISLRSQHQKLNKPVFNFQIWGGRPPRFESWGGAPPQLSAYGYGIGI